MPQRFLTPRWIIAHLTVVVLAGLFIRLGLWQLDRLAERRAANEIVMERRDAPTVEFYELVEQAVDEEQLEFRTVSLQGTFDTGEEVLIRSRTSNGEAGFHVVTPLIGSNRQAVLVNRGWVPLELDTPQAPEAAPPAVLVEVVGVVRVSELPPSLGPDDPSDGVLARMYWIDIPRIQQQSTHPLAPVYIELRGQSPPQSSSIPVPPPASELSEGSHLAYALQWFSFALIGVIGYGALLRRSVRPKRTGSFVAADGQPVDDSGSRQ
jgi:surfeit locus 1 family protein